MLAVAGGARNVKLMRHDVLPGKDHRLQQAPVACSSRQFAQPDQVGQHFISFAVRRLMHGLFRCQRRKHLRAARLVPGAEDVAREIEITTVVSGAIEQHNRLKHARRRHADVFARLNDALLGGESGDEQIPDAAAGGQRFAAAGVSVKASKPIRAYLCVHTSQLVQRRFSA